MSRLFDARAAILDALDGAGITTSTSGTFSAPCVLVEPGDPWMTPQRLPGRTCRWKLTAVAGRADSEGALLALAGLIDAVDVALLGVSGVGLPTWARPVDLTLDGAAYGASVGTVEQVTP